jgi:polyferredoxin
MEHHGGLISYWSEHYNIGFFTTLISIIYLIISYEYISCLKQRHQQQQQISLSGLFLYLIISSEYLYYLMKLHHMDLTAVVLFAFDLILIIIFIISTPFVVSLMGMLFIGSLSILLVFVGEDSLLGKLLDRLANFLNQLADLTAKFLSFARKKISELLESEFCKKPPEA